MRLPLTTAASLILLASCAAEQTAVTPPEEKIEVKKPNYGILEIGPAAEAAAMKMPERPGAAEGKPAPVYRRLAELMEEIEAKKPEGKRRDFKTKIKSPSMVGQSITDFLALMAAKDQLDFSYVVDPGVKGSVTINSISQPDLDIRDGWLQLESVLLLNGAYAAPDASGALQIMPLARMSRDMRITPFTPQSNVAAEIVSLARTPAAEAVANLKPFLSEGATAAALPRSNAVLLVDNPSNVARVSELLKLMDGQAEGGWPQISVPCREVPPSNIAAELQNIMPVLGFPLEISGLASSSGATAAKSEGAAIRIAVVERLNTLVISAPNRETLDEISRWVKTLDSSGSGDQERLFTYPVKHGEARDLINALLTFFPNSSSPDTAPQSTGRNDVSGGQSNSNPFGQQGQFGQSNGGGSSTSSSSGTRLTKGEPRPENAQATGRNGQPAAASVRSASVFDTPITIHEDARQNQLVMRTSPRAWNTINAMLSYLDAPSMQVMVQVNAVEVTLTGKLAYGVQYALQDAFGSSTNGTSGQLGVGNSVGKVPAFGPAGSVTPGLNALLKNAGAENEFALLHAVDKDAKTELLFCPQILTSNGELAKIQVGKNVPYIASSSQTNGGNPTQDVQYKDVGVILSVTPRVSADRRVTLDLSQEISDTAADAIPGVNSPVFTKNTISTKLTVEDGETLLLGGMVSHGNIETSEGIPLLKDIPWIGWLFGANTNDTDKKELVLFVKVKVIENKSSLQKVLERYRETQRVQDAHPELK
ncbi:MAG: hypothetical protein RL095_3615 [Verrucomicrobiota bacterium]|jgi:general secretion pathway protein D